MSLQLGDTAPDFTLESTDGPIRFNDYAGDHWLVFFSHPKDFTPVCTTELGAFARRKGEFEARDTKLLGLSVDSAANHQGWARSAWRANSDRATPSSPCWLTPERVIRPSCSTRPSRAKKAFPYRTGWHGHSRAA